MKLPQELRDALDTELDPYGPKKISALVSGLSNRYRSSCSANGRQILASSEEVAAYAGYRMPATFGAIHSALRQVESRLPGFCPETLLDVGAGPGTAMWAAVTIWPDLRRIVLLERDERMIDFGRRLSASSSLESVQRAEWLKVDITRRLDHSAPRCDLVVVSYVLGELAESLSASVIRRLWDLAGCTLVIIEPGTPSGFSRVRQYREQLLALGSKTIAPCPHDAPCPLRENDWCHFAQRIERSRLHRHAKGGGLSYEDEKFSYVAVSHLAVDAIKGRVIRHPRVRPGHIRLEICTPDGLTSTAVTRKHRDLYREARDLQWGSVLAD